MTVTVASIALTDLIRVSLLPVFAWAAYRDIRTRRVTNNLWIPLTVLAVCLLIFDGWFAKRSGGLEWTEGFLLPVGVSIGFVVPLAYAFWWVGGFGGADAKALMVIALLFPTAPSIAIGVVELPVATTPIGAFSFTILTNAVIVGIAIPIVLAARNALAGRTTPAMFIGWPVRWTDLPLTHGKLLERDAGFTRSGLDLDALRMYLRWRGLTLAELREDPAYYRSPSSIPTACRPPTDGAVDTNVHSTDGGDEGGVIEVAVREDDEWGAEAFLSSIDGSAYGTSPEGLRGGLEVLGRKETVWISPGTPFLVPVFVGLLIAFTYGDLLVGTLL